MVIGFFAYSTLFLILIYPFLFLIYQLILFLFSKEEKLDIIENINYPFLSIIVPIKGERISVIQGLIDNISKLIWDKEKIEIIIVSDDIEEYFDEIKRSIKIPDNLKVYLYRREEKLGYKSGALLYGYQKSKGDLILTIDVDSRLPPDSIIKSYYKMLNDKSDAITLRWVGYSDNKYSLLAKGLIIITSFLSRAYFIGKEKANLIILPLGSGTLFKKEALDTVGGWDYKLIQDDLEIGTRLIYKNKRISSSYEPIYVEVTDNFFAFYIQQTRWAMGTGEILRNRLKYIINSKISLLKKLDLIFYLLQYTSIISIFFGSILLEISDLLLNQDILFSVIFLYTIIFLSFIFLFYLYELYKFSIKLEIDKKSILSSIGNVIIFSMAISPLILFYFFKGLFSNKNEYIVTPKGGNKFNKKYNILFIISFLGILYIIISIIDLLDHYYLSFLYFIYYSYSFIYTIIYFYR